MEFNEVAVTRKSIRKYAARPVAKEDIEAMLRCAMEAPSWKNSQTARYHVITSSTMLQAMKQEGLAPFNAENTKDAPVLIVTSFVKDVAGFDKDGTPSNELGNLWGAYDLGLHNEDLLLKARDLGLDTLVMGIRDAKAIQRLLNIPETEIIVSVISVGYKAMDPEKPKRKKLDDIRNVLRNIKKTTPVFQSEEERFCASLNDSDSGCCCAGSGCFSGSCSGCCY